MLVIVSELSQLGRTIDCSQPLTDGIAPSSTTKASHWGGQIQLDLPTWLPKQPEQI